MQEPKAVSADALAAVSPQPQGTDQPGGQPSGKQPEGVQGKDAGTFVTKDQFDNAFNQLQQTIEGVKRGSQGLVDKSAQNLKSEFEAALAQKFANIDSVKESLKGTANEMSAATQQMLENKAIRDAIAEVNGSGGTPQTPQEKMAAAAQQIQGQQPAQVQDQVPAHLLSAASILEAYNVDLTDFPEKSEINANAEPQEVIRQATAAAIKHTQRKAAEAKANPNTTQNQQTPNNTMLAGGTQAATPGNPIINNNDPDSLIEDGLSDMGY